MAALIFIRTVIINHCGGGDATGSSVTGKIVSVLFSFFFLCYTVGVIRNGTLVFLNFSAQDASISKFGSKSSKLCKLGVFWNPQDLLFMMGTEILKIDAS